MAEATKPDGSRHPSADRHREWVDRPLFVGDWRDLRLAESLPLLTRFASHDDYTKQLVLDNWPTRVRALKPSFYPRWMVVEFQAGLPDGEIGIATFLYGPRGSIILNGTSAPIHVINARGYLTIETPDAARDYLRLFCNAVHGPSGRFQIIESSEGIPALRIRGLLADKPALASHFKELLGPVMEVGPPQVTQNGRNYAARAYVVQDELLYLAEFDIRVDGLIQMVDDSPLGAVEGRAELFRPRFQSR